MSDTITEHQGREIVRLLEKIADQLDDLSGEVRGVRSEVERLDGISDVLSSIDGGIGEIAKSVSSIEMKD